MARRSTASADEAKATAGAQPEETPSVGEQAHEATEQVQETMLRLTDSVREQAVSRLGEQKEKLAGRLETMSLALRTAGSEVRQQDNRFVAQSLEGAASRLEQWSGSLRENEVDALTGKVEQVARERPVLFLGTTLGVGLVASRLFKTSSRNQAERDRERARREEERQKHLREEEALQRSATYRVAAPPPVPMPSAAVAQESDRPRETDATHGGADLPGAVSDDLLADVPPAPGYGDAVGSVDEEALTSALLDPTGLGVGTADVPLDADDDGLRAAELGRERS